MRCEEFEDRLNDALDSRKRPEWDAELRLHCETCAECRELAGSYGLLLDGFYALKTPEPPADLSMRVLDALLARPLTTRRASLASAVLATTAAVLFIVVPMFPSRRAPQVAYAPLPSATLEALAFSNTGQYYWSQIVALPLVGPVLIAMTDKDETTDPYAEMAKGTGQGLAVVVLYMPPIGASPGMMGGGANRVSSVPLWPERMSAGLRPVSELVNETVGLLLQVLPGSDTTSRSEQPAA